MNLVLLAAILPAFLLVFYIWMRDSYQREPLSQILKGVAYGVISAGIALVLETLIGAVGLTGQATTWLGALWNAFVGAAMPEEAAKLLMLWLLLRHNKHFDERFDGIVYACCIAMGFAGTENIIYLFSNLGNWEQVAMQRAIFAVPGHFLFGVAMGYFYAQVAFRDIQYAHRSLIFFAPVMLHGIYDGLLFMANVTPAVGGVILLAFYVFCLLMFRGGRKQIRKQISESDPNKLKFF